MGLAVVVTINDALAVASERVESLARLLHEAGRSAVERNLLVNANPFGPRDFVEWDDLTNAAKAGRISQASWLIEHGVEVRMTLEPLQGRRRIIGHDATGAITYRLADPEAKS
jgi:hypothetical protein